MSHLPSIPTEIIKNIYGFQEKKSWDSFHARLNSHYEAWSYKKKKDKNKAYKNVILIIRQRKAFYRQRIPESSCVKKETFDIDIHITSRNGDKKIMQSIRITGKPPSRIRKWNQLSQFR